ncbi:hypothetical protein PGTUg99_016481 [Puccinia graminis f. sp. tritici]|uniref:Uncharacterized protein n=1 Tax=Puccinia graminis f. sp. tritici TaxID=56615 RepID=A0A5B0R7C7_PUCGR|nr:hypothetical protein PGTUg99_016481 [Puccinia graminis f. sp. tritici]
MDMNSHTKNIIKTREWRMEKYIGLRLSKTFGSLVEVMKGQEERMIHAGNKPRLIERKRRKLINNSISSSHRTKTRDRLIRNGEDVRVQEASQGRVGS